MRERGQAEFAANSVDSPPPQAGESHVSRTLLHWKKELILKKAFLIRESLDGNPHFDFP
jgi:hypothetical protein